MKTVPTSLSSWKVYNDKEWVGHISLIDNIYHLKVIGKGFYKCSSLEECLTKI